MKQLFCEVGWDRFELQWLGRISRALDETGSSHSQDDVCRGLVERFRMKPAEVELGNHTVVEQWGVYVVTWPISGEPELFDVIPGDGRPNGLIGEVRNGRLVVEFPRGTQSRLVHDLIRSNRDGLATWLPKLRADTDRFNAELPDKVAAMVQAWVARRQRERDDLDRLRQV